MDKNKPIILIADDNTSNLQLLGSILSKAGYDIAFALNGEETLEKAKNTIFDLILLDVLMPGIDGLEVCRRLKTIPETQNIPIIFLIIKNDSDSIIKGFDAGGHDYVPKPYNSHELLSRIRLHLQLEQQKRMLQSVNLMLEQKVIERTSQLQDANKQLSRLDKAKSDFLHLINHELRTPLNGIIGFSEILKDSITSPQQKTFIEFITKSADRLVRLSEAALLITSLQADNYKVKAQPILLKDIVDWSVERCNDKAKLNEIEIVKNINPEDIVFTIDRDLCTSCFEIVLLNAIEHSPPFSQVFVNCYIEPDKQDYLVVEVIDSGSGFSDEAVTQLYEFFCADDIDFHSEGFGLGLATAKLIMDTITGKISIKNLAGKGASVKLYFKK